MIREWLVPHHSRYAKPFSASREKMKTTYLNIILFLLLFSCKETADKKIRQNSENEYLKTQAPIIKNQKKIENTGVMINSIEDIVKLKKRGTGISTFGASNQEFEVINKLDNFGKYNLFDTTETKSIEYIGTLDIMTETKISKHKYDSNNEKVIAFKTENDKFDFRNKIKVGEIFSPILFEQVKYLNNHEYQFQINELDYIVTTNENNEILSITVGEFIKRKSE
jgi:hypothetical protein